MIILTGLGESSCENKVDAGLRRTVIALKTRSAPLSVTAFIPLVGPAYLAHLLRTNSRPEDMGEIVLNLSGDGEKGKAHKVSSTIEVFRHGLLDPFWEPEFFYRKPEEGQFQEAKKVFSRLRTLIRTPAFERRQGVPSSKRRKKGH